MKINMLTQLVTADGTPMIDEQNLPVTIRGVLYSSLKFYNEDEKPGAELATKLYELINKVFSADEVAFTADEVVLLKKKVGAGMANTELSGLVIATLEPKES